MNARIFAGGLLAYGYNHWVGNFPSRRVRGIHLTTWLVGAWGRNPECRWGVGF